MELSNNLAWKYLIDVIFNGTKEVPIELIANFKALASPHKVENYCNYLRNKILPEYLKDNSWEEYWLEKLSNILPENVEILVLKGAAARKMNLYSLPLLRQCSDLDIYVHKINDFNKRLEFVETLAKVNNATFPENWTKVLKILETTSLYMNSNMIDIHFCLFSPLGNAKNPLFGRGKKNNELENEIVKRAISYNSLKNIKIMGYEDFWFYNIFHFLKNYPLVNLGSILDAHLLLEKKRTTTEILLEHAKKTNQVYLYRIGLYILGQLNDSYNLTKPTFLEKSIFKTERIIHLNKYSIKSRIFAELSKGIIASSGNRFLSFIYGFSYLLINNFISSDLENRFNLISISNLITKVQVIILGFKNLLKSMCLKASDIGTKYNNNKSQIINSEKKLISLRLDSFTLTFNVPLEFYDGLARIWDGFLTNEHLDKSIVVEKIQNETTLSKTKFEVTFNNSDFYFKSNNETYGKVNLNGSGELYTSSYWGIRSFAIYLLRAMTFERNNLLLPHAGVIKLQNKTLIFPGGSSTGKTTFYNLLTKNGIDGINDDTLLLKKHDDNLWYVYPTPFTSNNTKPPVCPPEKLDGIIDLIKVAGGHQISLLDKDEALASLLNHSISEILIDDAGFIKANLTNKILDLSKQLKHFARIKFSLEDITSLINLIKNYIESSNLTTTNGADLTRLIELRGNSMEPTFIDGDILAVEEVNPKTLKSKDIICFTSDTTRLPIVHRIKYILKHKNETVVITKGDNQIFEDLPVFFNSGKKVLRIKHKLTTKIPG